MKVCLVRHGETAWSLSGRHTGSTDLALTANGEDQARALTPRLQALAFSQVLVSPRLRARQTCELSGLGMHSQIDVSLSEWDYGPYDGLRTVDIRRELPGWSVWHDGCAGGESPADVSERADRLITRLCAMQGTVALFSHAHFGAALAARWIGLAIAEGQHFTLHPASLSFLGIDDAHDGRRTIELWNETLAL